MNRHLYHQIRTIHVLSVIAVFAISAGILLAAQSGCIGATLAGTDGSYNTPDTGLSEHAPVQAVTAWEGMSNLSAACQIADTFADMLFTGMLDAAYAVHAVLSLTAVGNITDDSSLVLGRASDITTFVSGGHTYAAVAAYTDYGVQILNVTNLSNITAASSIRDMGESTPDRELRGAQGITTFESGVHTYAAVAAHLSDSVQILNVTDPSDITAVGSITDDGTNADDLELWGAYGITTFVSGDHIYAAVAASDDNGVQILNVTDPLRITPAGHITDDGTNTDSLELWDARGITIFELGVHTYAAVAAYEDDGVQILNVTDPLRITAAGNITDTDTLVLDGASGITTFVSGVHTYAAVAAYEDDGVQILDITDPLRITPAGSIRDPLKLNGAQGITTFTLGDHTYVAVAANRDNGVQILDVTNPLRITAAGNIRDANNNIDDLELHRVQGITTFTSGDHIYAAVAAYEDDGVQIIRIDIPPDTTLPADAFVTTWRTTSEDESITLPLVGTDITINWGDGSTTAGVSTPVDHIYNTAGDYTVQITGGLTWFHLNNAADASKLVSLDQWGTASWASMENAFSGASNMVYNAGDAPDLSGVTDMSSMFDGATAFDGDLSSWDVSSVTEMDGVFAVATSFNQTLNAWDVSSVTDMNNMFYYATSFNQPLNAWDVSSVTYMNDMFHDAASFNQPLNAWDVSSVTSMNCMFLNAHAFNQPLNAWDVSSVSNMNCMFYGATSFNQPLNAWDVSSVTAMNDMFLGATAFDQDLANWYVVQDLPPVLTAYTMFPIRAQNSYLDGLVSTYSIDDTRFVMDGKTLSLNSTNLPPVGMYPLDITAPAVLGEPNAGEKGHTRTLSVTVKEHRPFITTWTATDSDRDITLPMVGTYSVLWGDGSNSTNVSDSQSHPYGAAGDYAVTVLGDGLEYIRLHGDDTNALQLKSIDQWGDTRWTTMHEAFSGARNMVYNATDSPDLSLVTDMSNMFGSATAFDGDLSSWDVSSVTDMSVMFFEASSFNGDLSSWDVSSVTGMSGMFAFATAFNQPLNAWDVSSVTNMFGMFDSATSFNQTLNAWDVSSVTEMSGMFAVATSFNQPLNTWDVSSVSDMGSMFAGATAFDQDLANWYVVQDPPVLTANAMFSIRAQNSYLDGLVSTYSINDTRFVMDGKTLSLNFTNLPPAGMYPLDITAPAVLGEPNAEEEGHTRTLIVTVKEHRPFITTWTASDSDRDITLPMVGTYSILWGDGSHSPNVNGSQSHRYGAAGDYAVTVLGDGLEYIRLHGDDANALQLKSIDQWGDTRWTTMDRAFYEARNMVYNATDSPDLSGVTDMSGMFLTARAFNGDLSSWNVSSIRDMHNMFGGARAFNGDLSSWDVSSVTSMSNMFGNARAFNGDLSSWDVSSVTNMTSMFRDASTFDRPLNVWDVSSVTDMSDMFGGASSFNQTLSSWNVSSVTDMSVMFFEASSFNGDLSSWDVSSVTDMNAMFFDASSFNGDLSSWDVSSVSDMGNMFFDATAFNQSLNYWDVSSVTNMHEMFYGAISFNQPLNDWNVSSINSTFNMFYGATAFNQPLNDWDVSSVTDLFGMFAFATAFNQPLNAWDVSSVTDMFNMFYGATAFNQPLNAWDVSSVTNMHEMFYGAISFNQPLNAWDVSSVSDMGSMFAGATAFDQDLSGWYVVQDPPVLTANAMFSIRAQNSYLDDLVSTYFIVDTRFVMDGKILSLNSTNLPPAGIYPLDITAPAVLGEPNAEEEGHTRTLIVTVKGEHRPFITTWRTESADQSITINFVGDDMNISWGDGATETNLSGSQTHTYANVGDYRISVTGGLTGLTLDRPDLFGRPNVGPVPELASIDQWGGISWTNMSNAFAGASNMTYRATDTPDLSLVTDMSNMFGSATAFDGDLSSWDVSSVTGMSDMFAGTSSFNHPLNDWDVSKVTDMSAMFSGAASFNQPLNDWDVSSVTSMSCMFVNAYAFNQPLNDWDVSSVSNMSCMFWDANSFNHPLNVWDVSSVRNTNGMFLSAHAFNHPLNAWDVSSVSNMGSMFYDASSFNHPLNAWDVSKVTDMGGMFAGAHTFNHPLNDWDVSSVTNMGEMLLGASSFNHPLNAWDVSSVSSMGRMFIVATDFNQPLNAWDVSSVIDMKDMFNDATSFNQDLSSWYITPDSAVLITDRSRTLTVMPLSPYIGEQSLGYTVSDARFVMNGRTLSLSSTDTPTAGSYDLAITATTVLDEPNAPTHTRTVTITVSDPPAMPFITTWRTDSANQTITIPVGGSTARYSIDWGDNSPAETDITGDSTHTYREADSYTVSISGGLERIYLDGQQPNAGRLASIDQWGDMYWTSMSGAFDGAYNMVYNATDTPDLGLVSDMSRMFAGAAAFDGEISEWDVSAVRDMSGMFDGATSFNQLLNSWNVSSVRDMSGMFDGATSFNQPLKDWDVLAVRDISGMFDGATSFDQPLKDWDVLTVRDMSGMFDGATSFDQPLNDWDVLTVRDMSGMFDGATSFDQPLNDWDVLTVRDMSGMFDGATSFDQLLNSWNVSSVRDMSDMFAGATSFNQPLNSWNVSSVRDMSSIFDGATLFDRPLDDWDVSSTTDMTRMFAGATSFNRPLDDWDISAATGMSGMFAGATTFNQNLSGWYVTLDGPAVIIPGHPRTPEVLPLSPYLDGHLHTYSVNNPQFVVAGRTLLLADPDSPPTAGNYQLDITTAAILGEPNTGSHTGTFEITVRDPVVRPFITTWRTGSANQTVTIPGTGHACNIDWGDGTVHLDISCRQIHTYAEAGTYTVSISGGLERFHLDGQRPNASRLASIDQWGDIRWTSMRGAFDSATNMAYRETDAPDLSLVSDMSGMFDGAISFNGDLSSWDVSAVTDMSGMFQSAYSFNGDLSSWDVSAVTDMSSMFIGATAFNGDLSSWNVSKVTDMSGMFYFATSFNGNLSGWNVSVVNDMSGMFRIAESFNQPLNSWDVSAVTDMSNMFTEATSFNGDLSSWNVSKVTDMSNMFSEAISFNDDLSSWDVSAVTNMNRMFILATSFNQTISSWDVSAVTDMKRMFYEASDFNQPLNSWNVSSVRGMSGMFDGATFFDQPLKDWDVSSVTSMLGMFAFATAFDQPLNDWDVSKVTDMSSMFDSATSFDQPLNDWDVSKVTSMASMFFGTSSFNQNLGNWYVTLDPDTIAGTGIPGVVGTISAQNQPLKNHSPTYVIVDGLDKNHFEIVPGNQLNMISGVSGKAEYSVNVTASGGSVFESGNNWRVLVVKVSGDINAPPVLNTIGDQTVNEFVELTFMATASDDDSLTFLLDGTFPSGAAITSAGVFTWTPTESQDGDHTITVQVTDGSLTDSETLTVTVNEVNVAPMLNAIGDKGTSELVELTFTATASDTDVVDNLVNTLTFLLDGTFPSGATITSAGVFTWTPTELQVGSHDITVQVTDGSLTDSETLTVTVNEVNVAPMLNTIGDQTVNEFVELTFMATASDDDSLTFLLDGTFPSGAAITSAGVFTWTPTESQDGDHTITVQVTDGSLTDSETLTVTVNEVNVAPMLNTIGDKGTSKLVELTFTATASDTDVVDNLVNTLTFLLDGTFPSGATITSAGVFTWTPTELQVGSHDITVQVTDGSLTDSETLTVTVKDTTAPRRITLSADAFITTWRTDSANQTITIPVGGSTAKYSIDWGDNSPAETDITGDSTHTYREADSYTVSISGGLERFHLDGQQPNAGRLASIEQWGDTRWTTMDAAFDGATNMVYRATDTPDLSGVTDMHRMFGDATAFNGDLSSWDVSKVTDMSDMFIFATAFNGDLSSWDVSSVTNMNEMFAVATSFNQPLNDWDVSSVTYMSGMFYYASVFNHPLNDWDVSRVTNMDDMFNFATAFSQNLGNWYVVANATSIARADVPRVVAEISAQNDHLNGHKPTYGISRDSDYAFFEIVNGNKINMTSVGTKSSYMVNVTASGSKVFEDGNNWRMLVVKVPGDNNADNADLGGLTISSGTLSPQFSSSVITYTASVANSVTQVTVTPTASDSSAAITVNGNTVTSDNGYIVTGLTVGEPNTVTVIVTAQDSTTKTYIITLTRAATLSDNADLGSLTISSGTLSPQFSSSVITYTASVDNSVTQVTVTPTASDSSAAITVNGNTVTSDIGYIVTGLNVDEPNTVTVIVTAQDSTTKTYIITLTRAATLSDNADLGSLTISSGTLSPQFSSSDIMYTASVDNSVTQVTVTSTASDSSAAITVNGNTVTSGTGYILTGLNVDEPNTVTVIVTAQDSTTKTYIITLTRTASLSDNADLGSLTISSGTLSPQFSSSDITYTASVANSVTQVTVTPTASDSSATITVNGNTVTSGTGYILTGLTVDEPNTVTVIVTAQDSTTKTYIITLTRAATLSDNADLGSLTISSGTLSPQFSSSDITYTASVDNSVTQVTVTPTASDSSATITVNGNTVTSGTGYILTGLTVDEPNTVTVIVTAQDSTTKTYTITVTVRDVPITVSSAAYNPGNGQLTITFNQDIATVDYSGLHVRSSANPDTGGITLSSVTGADYSGRTITATLDSEQQDQYDALQSPHLVVEDGAVTDTDGDRTTDVPPQPIRDASQKGSSSSSKAPIVHINTLAQSRLVDIPSHIAEQVESHDASDPLEPITPDDTFDLPLVINGYGYLLDAYENTLIPQTVTAGDNPVHITFTVYTEKEFAHFILYLNLQGRNTNYADSDTYITYKDDGTTSVTDPHGYIGSATVTVTQEDDSIPEKRTVRITIEFGEEPMGPTNMVAYMWNTDRKVLFVKIIDALEVVAASPESAMQAADPEPLEPDSVLPADPEPVTPDFADDAADPEPVPYDILGPDDYDDTQILQIIRMWSGFESESITDAQLLELLGLDDHQGADIPDWMMTELGVLVAKGTVTVDEFLVALQYVLEHV